MTRRFLFLFFRVIADNQTSDFKLFLLRRDIYHFLFPSIALEALWLVCFFFFFSNLQVILNNHTSSFNIPLVILTYVRTYIYVIFDNIIHMYIVNMKFHVIIGVLWRAILPFAAISSHNQIHIWSQNLSFQHNNIKLDDINLSISRYHGKWIISRLK